jgi:uncharacterized protein YgiM (DUF1202 family)
MGKLSIVLLCACAVAGSALAAPGDILYVQGNVVNMREGPSTKHPVVLKLRKGHKLMEFQRQGRWVEVGADRTGGKSGWIHSSLVGKQFIGGATTAPTDPKFQKFKAAFDDLNATIERKTGFAFFTKAENMGDGIVQVTATDTWLSAPLEDRKSNLRTIFQMWDEAEGSGLPIAVYVVDKYGNQRMSMKR